MRHIEMGWEGVGEMSCDDCESCPYFDGFDSCSYDPRTEDELIEDFEWTLKQIIERLP